MATDYDEVRADVKESQEKSLEALQSANAPGARSVTLELDEADGLDGKISKNRSRTSCTVSKPSATESDTGHR